LHHLMTVTIFCTGLLLVLVQSFKSKMPGLEKIYAKKPGTEEMVYALYPGPHRFIAIALALFLWFLLAHRFNRRIFLHVIQSFECNYIIASFIAADAAYLYNRYLIFEPSGVYDIQWQLLDIIRTLCINLPLGIVISTADSWRATRRSKIAFLLLAVAFYSYDWYEHRFGKRKILWIGRDTCLFMICSGPQSVYLASLLQIVLFSAKATVSYLRGHPFAFIRPTYATSGMPTAKRAQNSGVTGVDVEEVAEEVDAKAMTDAGTDSMALAMNGDVSVEPRAMSVVPDEIEVDLDDVGDRRLEC